MTIKRSPKNQSPAPKVIPLPSRTDNIIGIDPDVDRSGVAWLHPTTREMECDALPFPELLDYLQYAKKFGQENNQSLVVVVEAGWLNEKSCYHTAKGKGTERIAKNVGANHQVGKEIIKMCEHWSIPVVAQPPLRKVWSGPDRKITAQELYTITGLGGRNNQEMRDACLLAWNHADLPIIITNNIKPKK